MFTYSQSGGVLMDGQPMRYYGDRPEQPMHEPVTDADWCEVNDLLPEPEMENVR